MSHFTVLIIGPNPEAQLAPFQENNMGDCPREYCEFVDKQQEVEDAWKKATTDPKFANISLEEFSNTYWYKLDPEKGRYGYWENPNSKWDWYVVGGRWSGFFPTFSGEQVDQSVKSSIDFEGARDRAEREALGRYDAFAALVEGTEPHKPREAFFNGSESAEEYENLLKQYREQPRVKKFLETTTVFERYGSYGWEYPDKSLQSRESVAEEARNGALCTFAVVKDGEWYERGQMGWFGHASDEKSDEVWNAEFHKLIDGLPGDTLLTLVDCHI